MPGEVSRSYRGPVDKVPVMPEWPDSFDGEDEDNRCERCCGEGFVEYNDAPDTWGEDCPSEVNHLVTCPDCRGTGEARRPNDGAELRRGAP